MNDILDRVLCALIGFCVGYLSVLARRVTGSWINPWSVLCGLWFFYIVTPLFFAWQVPVNPVAVAYVFIFLCVFCLAMFLFDWQHLRALREAPDRRNYIEGLCSGPLFWIWVGLFVTSIIAHAADVFSQGVDFGSGLIHGASEYANLRYSGELQETIFGKVGSVGSFALAGVAGFVANFFRGFRRYVIFMLSLLPSFVVLILQSAKGLFLISAVMIVGGIFLAKECCGERVRMRLPSFKVVLAAFGGVVALGYSFLSRGVTLQGGGVFDYFVSYAFGHLFAFSDWFSVVVLGGGGLGKYQSESLSYGFYTLNSFFRLLGDHRKLPLGTYVEYFEYPGAITTNIYTAFRGVIQDFGFFGSFAFSAVAGLFSALVYRGFLRRDFSPFYASCMVYVFAIAYQSFLVSSLVWPTVLIAFVLTWVAFFWAVACVRIRRKGGRGASGVRLC